MKDRIPVNPGRVLVTPENGSAFYATMTRADNPTQEGDPLNKNTLLKDETAALFGLGADAVPNDVFSFLGKYNQHWWKVTATSVTDAHFTMGELVSYSNNKNAVGAVYCKGSSIAVDADGNLSIPGEISVTASSTEESVAGLYIRCANSDGTSVFYYCDSGATIKKYAINTVTIKNYRIVTGHPAVTNVGAVTYLRSEDINAYPHSGIVNSLMYEYLGVPFENAVTAPKISQFNYKGTGTRGADNPTILNCEFNPKILYITQVNGTTYKTCFIDLAPVGQDYVYMSAYIATSSFTFNIKKSVDGKMIYIMSTADQYGNSQFNGADFTYYVTIIG